MNLNSFIIYRLFANIVALWLAGKIIPGFQTGDLLSLLCASVVLTFLHVFIRPLMVILTFPLQVLSLGIVYILFNAVYVKLTSFIVHDIVCNGFLPAIGAAIVVSFVTLFLDSMAAKNRMRRYGSENSQRRY